MFLNVKYIYAINEDTPPYKEMIYSYESTVMKKQAPSKEWRAFRPKIRRVDQVGLPVHLSYWFAWYSVEEICRCLLAGMARLYKRLFKPRSR